MSYSPSQDNPLIPSGIVYFGNPATDQKYEATSSFTYDSSNARLLVNNIVLANSGTLGSTGATNALTIKNNGDVDFVSNVVIAGNLTVQGSQTILNTETLAIEDNIILLNRNVTGVPTTDAGLEIERGDSANVRMYYDEGTDQWKFTNDGTNHYAVPTGIALSLTFAGDSGTSQTISNNDTFTVAGGSGISTIAGATDTVTVHLNVDNSTVEINSDSLRVKDSGITSAKLANGAVGVDQLGTSAVTDVKLASDSVTTSKILDSNVTNAKLANSSVTENKLSRSVDSSFTNNETISSDINLVTGGAGGITVKLPTPTSGRLVMVKKIDSDVGPVTISRNNSESIDGTTSKALYYQYESLTFVSDGTNWFIV